MSLQQCIQTEHESKLPPAEGGALLAWRVKNRVLLNSSEIEN